MTKRRWILIAFLAAIVAVCCACLAACHKDEPVEETTYSITWTVDSHATVSVEGYETPPTTVTDGEKISFTVTCDSGYQVESVTANGTKLTAASDSGKYSRTISRDTEIVVTTSKAVKGVAVTTNPTNLTYHAGESLDTTGMVVTITYEDNSTEAITDYVVSPAVFSMGDESFTVTYDKIKPSITSSPVSLTKAVTALITIDPRDGTIDENYISGLQNRSDLSVTVDQETGIISIEHSGISEDIEFPTEDEISYEGGVLTYGKWVYETSTSTIEIKSIEAGDEDSHNVFMLWNAELATYSKIELSYCEYDGVTAPWLIITATFDESVDSAYLYLYEGNTGDSVIGDTYDVSGSGEQKLYYNLSYLDAYPSLAGEWMDIRLNSYVGNYEYSQQIVFDIDNPVADIGGAVQDSENSYTLLVYQSEGEYTLKVAFRPYTTTFSFDADTSAQTLTISGQVNLSQITNTSALDGATVSIDIGDNTYTGSITTAGAWTITISVSDLPSAASATNSQYLQNFKILSSGTQIMFAETMYYTLATDTFEYSTMFGSPSNFVNSYSFGGGIVVYVGMMGGDWQQAFLCVTYDVSFNSLEISTGTDGKPVLIFTGTYSDSLGSSDDAIISVIDSMFSFSLQGYSSWTYYYYADSTASNYTIAINNGTFTITCDILTGGSSGSDTGAGLEKGISDTLIYGHLNDSNMSIECTPSSVTYDGIVYELFVNYEYEDWLSGLTCMKLSYVFTYSSVKLDSDTDGNPLLVFSGTYSESISAEQAVSYITEYFDFSLQGYSTWTYYFYTDTTADTGNTTVSASDGTFTVTCKLTVTGSTTGDDENTATSLDDSTTPATSNMVLYGHLSGSNMTLAAESSSVTYNGVTYSIQEITTAPDSDGSWLLGCTGIYMTTSN